MSTEVAEEEGCEGLVWTECEGVCEGRAGVKLIAVTEKEIQFVFG